MTDGWVTKINQPQGRGHHRREIINTYTIYELQNAQSQRQGNTITVQSLTAAKRAASKMQMFQGTVMLIAQNGYPVASKVGNKWIH